MTEEVWPHGLTQSCPRCGNKVWSINENNTSLWFSLDWVGCHKCGHKELRSGWNTRPVIDALVWALRRAEKLAGIAYDWDLGTDGQVEIDGQWVSCSDLREEFEKAQQIP